MLTGAAFAPIARKVALVAWSIAARTNKVQLASATVLLPCNQPLRVAEEWALLDLLSDGRAIFSAGRGYDEREYRAFQIAPAHLR